MEDHDRLDEELRKVVRSVGRAVPTDLEARVRAEAERPWPQPKSRSPLVRRRIFLVPLSGAAALLLGFLVLVPLLRGRREPPIAEIRTEFELKDKNIMIIFIQRPDFPALEAIN
jgi:hypothetical protein